MTRQHYWQSHRYGVLARIVCAVACFIYAQLGVATEIKEIVAEAGAWIHVDTQHLTLTVYSANNALLKQFPNISIGSGGVSKIHYQGDETTPLGTYRLVWINSDSAFNVFLGINYPNQAQINQAYASQKISKGEYQQLSRAEHMRRKPPTNTPLGGHIGIHGLGSASQYIHERVNWTDGCIALDNEQLRALMPWVNIGMRVVIE